MRLPGAAPDRHAVSVLALQPAPRLRPRLTAPIVAGAVWLALVATWQWVQPAGSVRSLCLFRNVTGVPCPTCGTSRAAVAAIHGRFLDAAALNPMMAAIVMSAAAWLVLRGVLGRRIAFHPTPRLTAALWVLAAAAFAANWTWVIARHSMHGP